MGPHPNHVKSVLMAITFSSKVHGLSSALITLTVPSAATIFSELQKSAISSNRCDNDYRSARMQCCLV